MAAEAASSVPRIFFVTDVKYDVTVRWCMMLRSNGEALGTWWKLAWGFGPKRWTSLLPRRISFQVSTLEAQYTWVLRRSCVGFVQDDCPAWSEIGRVSHSDRHAGPLGGRQAKFVERCSSNCWFRRPRLLWRRRWHSRCWCVVFSISVTVMMSSEKAMRAFLLAVARAFSLAVAKAFSLAVERAFSLAVDRAFSLAVGRAIPLAVARAFSLAVVKAFSLAVGRAFSLAVERAFSLAMARTFSLAVASAFSLAVGRTISLAVERAFVLTGGGEGVLIRFGEGFVDGGGEGASGNEQDTCAGSDIRRIREDVVLAASPSPFDLERTRPDAITSTSWRKPAFLLNWSQYLFASFPSNTRKRGHSGPKMVFMGKHGPCPMTRALQWSGNPYGTGYGVEMDGNGTQFMKILWIGLDLGQTVDLKRYDI